MKRITKEQRTMEKGNSEFEEWKNNEGNIRQIENIGNKKKRKELIDNTYLIKDEKGDLILSGGGKIILFFALSFGDWNKYLDDLKKHRHYNHYFEVKKYLYREKMYKINLLKKFRNLKPSKILELI